jgi:fibronectin type III domain protein
VRRILPRRAVLLAATLVLSTIAPGFFTDARADDPTVSVTVTVRDLAGAVLEGDMHFFGSDGAELDSDGVTLHAPPGRYTLRFQAPVPGYSGGFKSGDDADPGLFLETTLDVTADATLDWTVPIVDFPVHVIDTDGQPGAGVSLDGESRHSFELAPGVVGSGRLLNARAVQTDSSGNGTLQGFPGAAPALVQATDDYELLGSVSPAPSDTSVVVVLDSPILQGQLLDGRGLLPAPAVSNAWVAFVGGIGYPGQFAPWPYGNHNGSYRLQAAPGDRTLHVSNADVYDRADPSERPATATLPGTWSFEAPHHHTADATVDLTIPDAAPADILVLGADGQPVSGVTMQYSATARNTVDLAPGITAHAVASDTIGDVAGHFSPMLFGPSTLTFTLDGGGAVTGPLTISPGDQPTFRLDRPANTPSAPQNVSATAGDGKVKVTWDPPAFDGGSPITGYTVTASRNSSNFKASFGPSATSGTIRSLINGKTYSVTVVAKNANGTGAASAPISVTLDAVDPPTTTPTAPPAGGGNGDPLGGAGDDKGGPGTTAGSGRSGYWLLDADGAVYPFGDAAPYGDAKAKLAAAAGPPGGAVRAVDLEPTPSGRGYWVLDSRGRIHPFGDAPHLGDVAAGRLSAGEEPATLSATPSGAGYWVFTSRGRAIAFGDAPVLGDMTGTTLNGPVLDSVATPSGHGYYMVASDGGIFAFGDARFAGSMGGRALNAPVRSLVPDGDGAGYWLVAADGGVFAFDAPFVGSMGGRPLNKPVRGMVRYGNGYLMVGEDGGVFAFSDRPFTGSLGARPPASPVVSVAALA